MPVHAYEVTSQHQVRTKTPDGKDLVFLTGVVVFNDFGGAGTAGWRHDDLEFEVVDPVWARVDAVAPVIVPTAFGSWGSSGPVGWAVDSWGTRVVNNRIGIVAQIGADQVGAFWRVAYQITVIGILA
jgi:hypothetical protein